MIDLFFCRG